MKTKSHKRWQTFLGPWDAAEHFLSKWSPEWSVVGCGTNHTNGGHASFFSLILPPGLFSGDKERKGAWWLYLGRGMVGGHNFHWIDRRDSENLVRNRFFASPRNRWQDCWRGRFIDSISYVWRAYSGDQRVGWITNRRRFKVVVVGSLCLVFYSFCCEFSWQPNSSVEHGRSNVASNPWSRPRSSWISISINFLFSWSMECRDSSQWRATCHREPGFLTPKLMDNLFLIVWKRQCLGHSIGEQTRNCYDKWKIRHVCRLCAFSPCSFLWVQFPIFPPPPRVQMADGLLQHQWMVFFEKERNCRNVSPGSVTLIDTSTHTAVRKLEGAWKSVFLSKKGFKIQCAPPAFVSHGCLFFFQNPRCFFPPKGRGEKVG